MTTLSSPSSGRGRERHSGAVPGSTEPSPSGRRPERGTRAGRSRGGGHSPAEEGPVLALDNQSGTTWRTTVTLRRVAADG
ncbi:hypothetical protein, partial [Streptomyces hydrogenans]